MLAGIRLPPFAHRSGLSQIIIGPWVIDANRNVRVFAQLLSVRIGAMAMHLTDNSKVQARVTRAGSWGGLGLAGLLAQPANAPHSHGRGPRYRCIWSAWMDPFSSAPSST